MKKNKNIKLIYKNFKKNFRNSKMKKIKNIKLIYKNFKKKLKDYKKKKIHFKNKSKKVTKN